MPSARSLLINQRQGALPKSSKNSSSKIEQRQGVFLGAVLGLSELMKCTVCLLGRWRWERDGADGGEETGMGESKMTERGRGGGPAGCVEGEGGAAFARPLPFCTGFIGICGSGGRGRRSMLALL